MKFWCGTASWKLIWYLVGYRPCPILDLSKKNLRFRNRYGTSGNAMEIFSICERVAAFGWSYFRVLCCFFADRSIASVLVRVLHPCVALALWKLLRGCGSCVLIWRAHRNDNMSFVSQTLCSCTCVWELQSEKHLRITQPAFHIRASQPPSMWNVHSQNSRCET